MRRRAGVAFSAVACAAAVTGVAIALAEGSAHRVLAYFTIQSNILVAVTFARPVLRVRARGPWWEPRFAGGVLLAVLVTGLVYHLYEFGAEVRGGAIATGSVDWRTVSCQLLHTVTPISAAVAWALRTTPGGLRPRHAAQWLLYPFAYLMFTLLRGELLEPGTRARYPYPVLDVARYGYAVVLGNSLLFALAFSTGALAILAVDGLLGRLRGACGPQVRLRLGDGPPDAWNRTADRQGETCSSESRPAAPRDHVGGERVW